MSCGRRHGSRSTHEQIEVWLVCLAYKYSSDWINKIQNVKLNSTSNQSFSMASNTDYISKNSMYRLQYVNIRKRKREYLDILP